MGRLTAVIVTAVAALLLSLSAQAQLPLRLATTTSTYNSGLLNYLLQPFEQAHGIRVHVISVGTGAALRLGQDGDVDLVMTHAPLAEAAFVAAGHGVEPRALMYNDFVLVGPVDDPAGVAQLDSIADAFSRIAEQNRVFISRGDGSGTHIKELELWAGIDAVVGFSNYHAVGQGMRRALFIADELEGYTLTDRGTWLAMKANLDLRLLLEGDEVLFNPYQVILVNPERHPHVNATLARELALWLVSAQGQARIESFQVGGESLFFGSAE